MSRKRKRTTAFKFRPFSKKQMRLQYWWHPDSPHHDKDMIICDGSIRAGKTVAMIDSFLTFATTTFKHENFIIAGRSMGAVKRNILEPMFKILTAKNIDYHYHMSGDPHVIIGTNTFYLFGASNEASQDTLQGLTAAGAYLDEVALMPESFINQAIGRCSEDGAKIFLNCNPEGPYHWFKTDFIDQAEEKKIYRLHFTMEDNPSLSEKTKERYKRMFTGVFYDRMIKGLWIAAQGVIFSMFHEKEHVIHDNLAVDDFVIGIDYGTSNPTAFILIGIKYQDDGSNKYYIMDEYYHDGRKDGQLTDKQHYANLKKFVRESKILQKHIKRNPMFNPNHMTIYLDPSAASFKAEIHDEGLFRVVEADNDVLNGIRTVQSMISSESLYVHNDCENVKKEFASYVWDSKAGNKGIDKPIKEHDHALDGIRYVVYTIEDAVSVNVTEVEYDIDDDDDDW
ncbi:PBSX family phage terminase large subunit [Sporosarcina soli]|uniref:PBSX family phage terminase large subunit n=1 Tax=Sporosarcina soli TaxID=334736 RepID=A0ABW0TDW6_9BACL